MAMLVKQLIGLPLTGWIFNVIMLKVPLKFLFVSLSLKSPMIGFCFH